MESKMPLKSVLQIRLPLYLRNDFYEAAKKNNEIPAQLLRNFMRSYIKNSKDENAKQG